MDIPALLAQTRLFTSIPLASLQALAEGGAVCGYAGGKQVYEQGQPADCIYIVLSGRLRAETEEGRCLAEISRLETVGEIGLLSGQPRSTNMYATRDSILLRVERVPLLDFLRAHPDVALRLSEVVIRRLTQNQRTGALDAARRPRSFAVIPAGPGVDHRGVADNIQRALSGQPERHLLDASTVDRALGRGAAQAEGTETEGQLMAFLADREVATRHLLYVTDGDPSPWTRRCLRQADRILLVIHADHPPQPGPMIDALHSSGSRAPVDLVVVRNGGLTPGRVQDWKALTDAQGHWYLHAGSRTDSQRIARSLSGRAIGLVLGGGGARGFAHLGLMRAMDELAIPVDLVGGSSMGAFIGALIAAGHRPADALEIVRSTFVTRNLLNDYVLPRVALIRGRKFVQRLDGLFGALAIEDLPLPYYCVSTNLTRGAQEVHQSGRLSTWIASSMAVPGVAPPVVWRGELLCDGSVINSLPTDVMAAMARGPIIASDVSTEGAIRAPGIEGPDPEALLRTAVSEGDGGKPATLLSILFRTATLANESQVAQRAASADAYLRMPVAHIGMFEWKRLAEIERNGYEHARRTLEPLRPTLVGDGLPSGGESHAA